ncbi:Flavin-binding monooxygenase-like protein 12 [Elsinoe fawcettii]|nr:Flavin-binding monooxygenase-like protein 12 [Elsinoe fawcettii]
MTSKSQPRAIIIGCGTAGIALGARLRTLLKYDNFVIYEKEKEIGGTWYLNTYPGVGCDVDSHLYSYSFNLNPDWSRRFAEQAEILQYLNDTADKFGVRDHVRTQCEVIAAQWNDRKSVWQTRFRDLESGHEFTRESEILISCVGTISIPKDCTIPGNEQFKGPIWHSARWNHNFDLTGKTVGIVGNGCSAAQLVPHAVRTAAKVIQFQRSPQWINERPNREFTAFEKWCFRYLPLWQRFYRFSIWKATDDLHDLYSSNSARDIRKRAEATEVAIDYMKSHSPEKYHDILIPKFPLGCKRRIFDPGYLECLASPNMELTDESIQSFDSDGINTPNRHIPVDAIVMSTGFKIQEFLSPIKVIGKDGISLNDHWRSTRGAQAYKGTFVTGFPNFGIVFGPNAFPAHNSVIYTNEVQIEFLIKTVFRPMLDGDFKTIDVKEAAEMRDANRLQTQLKSMVWSGGCTNWNLDENGRNTTNSPINRL